MGGVVMVFWGNTEERRSEGSGWDGSKRVEGGVEWGRWVGG